MGAAGMELGRGQPSLQGLTMPQQRLQRTSPNMDILKWKALGQGETEPCLMFPVCKPPVFRHLWRGEMVLDHRCVFP